MKLITLDLRRSRRPRPAPGLFDVVRTVNESPPPMTVVMEHYGQTLVLAVGGDVDLHTAPVLREAIDSALGHRPRRLVVDLSLVQFLNSAGLTILLTAHRQAGQHTDLRLVATTRAVWRPLQITRLHEQLIIHASRSAAIAAPAGTEDEDRSPPGETRSNPSRESTQP